MLLEEIGKKARIASHQLAQVTTSSKNKLLLEIADQLWSQREQIYTANKKDEGSAINAGISMSLLDRLILNESRLINLISDLRNVATLPDPVNEVFEAMVLPNGLHVHKQRVPIGVLGVIYEARPNVTVDIAGLAIKSGNAVILRGGSETLNTNRTLVAIIRHSLEADGLSSDAVQFIDDPDRLRIKELLSLYEYVDIIIPRGGAALHKYCRENSLIPVITGGVGICHLFVDESADLQASLPVIRNAKIQRPTVCNALDTVLVHINVANKIIPQIVNSLSKDGVTFRVDPITYQLLADQKLNVVDVVSTLEKVTLANPTDFDTEWLSLVLGIKVVNNLDEALMHITSHSTGHSDGILTQTDDHAHRFTLEVDSAVVYVNASTRFTDGAQLGLGAEVAISTQRLHARGPMGLKELTTYKWVVKGNYQVREE